MDGSKRPNWFSGRRRQLPILAAFALLSGFLMVTASTIAGVIYQLLLTALFCTIVWRYWHDPAPSPEKVRRAGQRLAWFGSHPASGALLGAVAIAVGLFASFWGRSDLGSVAIVCGAVGGLIGFGLYFVFRTDPRFHEVETQDATDLEP